MRETLTISLPKGMRRKIQKAAKAEGVSQSEYVRRALLRQQFRTSLAAARAEMVPRARKMGIYTDEDVFKLIS
jgi:Arc/MetJ-type ribon-helix-helix transcriptional regulator